MTAPLTPEQVADVLDHAADLIERRPWGQGSNRHDRGEFCAVDSLDEACGGLYNAALAAMYDVIDLTRFPQGLAAWNDAPGRTKQEVLDAFRLAAKQQRGRSPA